MLIIGIAGGSGSGKTTFANKVRDYFPDNITLINMDSYYKARPELEEAFKDNINFDHPAAFDWPLIKTHLEHLKNGYSISMPVYDFNTSTRTKETKPLSPKKIILVEGIFTLYDEYIRSLMDIKCFLSVDSDIRFSRRINRDVKERGRTLESIIKQYYESVRPMYQKYLAPQKEYADIIIGERNEVAASILAARVNQHINEPEKENKENLNEVLQENI